MRALRTFAIAIFGPVVAVGAAQAADWCPFRYNEQMRQTVILPALNAHLADRVGKYDVMHPRIVRDGQHIRLAFEPNDQGFGGLQDFLIIVDACTNAVLEAHDDAPSSVASQPATDNPAEAGEGN